jgi:hypothetical protein
MIIIKKPHKAELYLSSDDDPFSNQFISGVTTGVLFWRPETRKAIKERRNLLWAFINTSPVGCALQPRTNPLFAT